MDTKQNAQSLIYFRDVTMQTMSEYYYTLLQYLKTPVYDALNQFAEYVLSNRPRPLSTLKLLR